MKNYNDINLASACETGYVMAIYRSGVEFGCWDKSQEQFPWGDKHKSENLLELHIFDETTEFRAMRTVKANGGFQTASISDNDFESVDYIDNDMLLLGETLISSDAETCVVEESGRKKQFYFPQSEGDFCAGTYLKVRDFYGFDENGLLYLMGYRLTGVGKEQKHGEETK